MTSITVSSVVHASLAKVWELWTEPKHIMQWNAASDDWQTSASKNDVRVGGRFSSTMRAKNGSAQFDFEGVYTVVKKHEMLSYTISDGRKVEVHFAKGEGGVKVTETFEVESENSEELQRQGWQSILNNFKKYVEKNL